MHKNESGYFIVTFLPMSMKLFPEIVAHDAALVVDNTLIISDIHIGYEEALNQQGILIPRLQFAEIIAGMERIFKQMRRPPSKIIINGDLKHEFGRISETEWRNCLKFIDFLKKYAAEIVIIKGNHDAIAKPIAEKRAVAVKNSEQILTKNQRILVTHGDKIPEGALRFSTIIIGHAHPAISLHENGRTETYKCFLTGKFRGKNLIVQPSFNPMVQGTDVCKEQLLGPFLQQGIDDFLVYAVADEIYAFGKVGNIKKIEGIS